MQAPPPTGTTGKALPRVGPLGAGVGAGGALEKALAAVASGAGALGSAPPTTTAPPTIAKESPTLARSAIVLLPSFDIPLAAGSRAGASRGVACMVIGGSGTVVDSAGTSDTTDAPTVEADNAATGLRQRGKPGGDHR